MNKPEFIAFKTWGKQLDDLSDEWTYEEIVKNASMEELEQLWNWLREWDGVVKREIARRLFRVKS